MEHLDTSWYPKFEKGREVRAKAHEPKDQLDWTPAIVLEIGTNMAYTIVTPTGAVKEVHKINPNPKMTVIPQESSEG